MPISAIVLTLNEEKNIQKCLETLSFCDEILVIDTGSTDKTISLATKAGARVIERTFEGDFAALRNKAMELATHDLILFVDADERVSPELARSIQKVMSAWEESCYLIRRRDFFWRTQLRFGETWSARSTGIIRLVQKGSGKWEGKVHETFVSLWPLKRLDGYLDHFPHPTIDAFLTSINRYSRLRADELYKKGKRTNWFEILGYPMGKFIYTYVLKLGFLDGPAGFVYSFMMSFHSFLVRSKLYVLQVT